MDDTKNRITKLCSRLSKGVVILSVLVSVVIVYAIAGLVAINVKPSTLNLVISSLKEPHFVDYYDFVFDKDMSNKGIAIEALVAIIVHYMLYVVILFRIRKLLRMIGRDTTPFTKKAAKEFRRLAIAFLIIEIIFDIVIALFAFTVLMLMSAIFDYGAYIQEKADETNRIQEEMIVSFAEITENKSTQTGNHVKRVSEYSRIIAEQMGLPESECERIRLASTMHDLGKLLIPVEILEKPGRLTDEEFATIKKHSSYGGELLDQVEGDIMQLARQIALDHHERPDGRGYPSSKTCDEISIEGRIVAVADVYDALTSKRSYKEAWKPEIAYDEIVKNSGTQFDSRVVDAFKAAYPKIEETRVLYADGIKALSFKPA